MVVMVFRRYIPKFTPPGFHKHTRPVRKPCHKRRNAASCPTPRRRGGVGVLGGPASVAILLLVLAAAVAASVAQPGVTAWHVDTATRTGQHVLRRGQRPGLRARWIFFHPLAAPNEVRHEQDRQQNKKLHGARPRTTSSAKREPTYASSSRTAPAYSTRTALRPAVVSCGAGRRSGDSGAGRLRAAVRGNRRRRLGTGVCRESDGRQRAADGA